MAVASSHHRQGVGRALLGHMEGWLRGRGFRLLCVKTRGPCEPHASYSRTRSFCRAMGFLPLFETTVFWGPRNPTPLPIKPLA